MRKKIERLGLSRRGFIRNSGLAALSTAAGSLLADARADAQTLFQIPGKSGLVVLNDRPINAETPAHLLDDAVTPADRMFVRNNGIPPAIEGIDADQWTLQIDGESCIEPKRFTLVELKSKFEHHTLQLQIECGGNGRSEYYPPATGNQWTTGAIGCPEWTGVRLGDILEDCGIGDDAVYVAYEGVDRHLSGDPGKLPISRGVPVGKALEKESLIAWAMNGEPLPLLHGFPLRMVCAGWPASVSGKWIRRIMIRDRVHDGPKMTGQSYRIPCNAVAPGAAVDDENMCIIESMPVKSLITFPKSGVSHELGVPMAMRGHAWAGDLRVRRVFISTNFGATWQRASLEPPVNRLAWQGWSTVVDFPARGYYEVWARAEDENRTSQPMVIPGWNPRGYLNNACHRIAVEVRA
jgi:DMSO/TMAO reductase YedYZ molybdopterin-dependent catalytic subunit